MLVASSTKFLRLPLFPLLNFPIRKRFFSQSHFPSEPCEICSEIVDIKLFKAALEGNNPYKAIPSLAKRCKALSKDHFSSSSNCRVAEKLQLVAHTLIVTRKDELGIVAFKDSSELYLSAFLKVEEKGENTSDLTGDGGKLALKLLSDYYRSNLPFNNIVDIGGQDPDFLKNFSIKANRILMDRNMLTPFFRKQENISYAIGDAVEIWKDENFLANRQKGRMLVSMNNLLNVLKASEAWQMLEATTKRMQSGDNLVITNLSNKQFEGRDNYKSGNKLKGIIEYNKIDKNFSFYKSTISDKFISDFQISFPDFQILKSTTHFPYKCKIKPKADSSNTAQYKTAEVIFTTILFEKV